MFIPKNMKNKIAQTFYDKNIEVLEEQTITDSEGSIVISDFAHITEFKGNVSFSNCKKIQEDYGLDYDIDIAITTDYFNLKINNFIKYEELIYCVSDVLKADSHNLIVAKKWRQ